MFATNRCPEEFFAFAAIVGEAKNNGRVRPPHSRDDGWHKNEGSLIRDIRFIGRPITRFMPPVNYEVGRDVPSRR